MTSTIGSNLYTLKTIATSHNLISMKGNILSIAPQNFKQVIRYKTFPPDEVYRVNLLNELIMMRDKELLFNNMELNNDEADDIINMICIN